MSTSHGSTGHWHRPSPAGALSQRPSSWLFSGVNDWLADPEEVAARAGTYELAFSEAGRGLDGQERAVNELRSRAGVLVDAAAIATSFFDGQVIRPGHDQPTLVWVAIGAFGIIALTVLAVLWPRHDWQFSANANTLISEYVEPETLPLPLVHRDLALHRAESYRRNADQLRWLFGAFRLGLLMVVVEVVAWVVALSERS
jgi:hypothetical protein